MRDVTVSNVACTEMNFNNLLLHQILLHPFDFRRSQINVEFVPAADNDQNTRACSAKAVRIIFRLYRIITINNNNNTKNYIASLTSLSRHVLPYIGEGA
jgi:hypothetical protein